MTLPKPLRLGNLYRAPFHEISYPMQRWVIGTAGHVDHGKTRLIQALTGRNTDRLPEEKKRGISIELGFAPVELDEGVTLGIVDVPGHERFVRTMISGASGVDAVLLVIAANEGIQAQTREHLDICRLLNVRHGVCAITKCDLVSPELLEQRKEEARSYLRETLPTPWEVIPASSVQAGGLDDLRKALVRMAAQLPSPIEDAVLGFPIDRVFSLAGAGTIVTGTLSGSSLQEGEKLVALPLGCSVQTRSLQVFDQQVTEAHPKTRLAMNLTGSDRQEIRPGQTLCRKGEVKPTKKVHAEIGWLETLSVKARAHVRILCGTQDIPGRIVGPKTDATPWWGEIRLLTPAVFRAGDRFIVRLESPSGTVGGGTILDPHPQKVWARAELGKLSTFSDSETLLLWLEQSRCSLTLSEIVPRISLRKEKIQPLLNNLAKSQKIQFLRDDRVVAQSSLTTCKREISSLIAKQAEIPVAEVLTHKALPRDKELIQYGLNELAKENGLIISHGRVQSAKHAPRPKHRAISLVEEAGLTPPTLDELAQRLGDELPGLRKIFSREAEQGGVVRVTDRLYYARPSVEIALGKLRTLLEQKPAITLQEWKEKVGLTRKYAVPLLEYFDRERYTLCRSDRSRIPGPKLTSN